MPGQWTIRDEPDQRPQRSSRPIPPAEDTNGTANRTANRTANGAGPGAEPGAGDAAAGQQPVFLPEQPRRSLDDLIVPAGVLHQVTLACSMVEHHTVLFDEWNLRRLDPYRRGTALNLYGPPGTGKSLCAEALAHRFGRRVIRVSYAEIESRYVGDTPKNIVRLFAAARQHDAVLVFDEADSMLGARLVDVRNSADHSVNVSRAVMLSQLDRFEGMVVFTSNLATNYDPAFVRRIAVHVRFDLPDQETRQRLWSLLLPPELPVEPEVEPAVLAAGSAGLSGGDITNVIIAAAAAAVGRAQPLRRVSLADLISEIGRARRAAVEVGLAAGPVGDPASPPGQAPTDTPLAESCAASE